MNKPKSNTAILFMTHIWNNLLEQRFYSLQNSLLNTSYDVILLLQHEENEQLPNIPNNINYYLFNSSCLHSLSYIPIEKKIIPGSNHFPVLQFYKDFPLYSYYWNIEYDVIFSGSWKYFFSILSSSNADFFSSHIESFGKKPFWNWWKSFQSNIFDIPTQKRVKSFNPIYGLSNRAIKALDNSLKYGNVQGHHEVVIPTIMAYYNFAIHDLGAIGEFVSSNLHTAFYTEGFDYSSEHQTASMRYRPTIHENEIIIDNILYHPCK